MKGSLRRPRVAGRGLAGQRGLSLIECAVALVIVALAVTMMMELDVETTKNAREATYNQVAALLANQVMTIECMGELPEDVETPVQKGPFEVDPNDPRFGDPETGHFPYRGFTWEVRKTIEEIDADTDLSATADEREDEELQGYVPPEGEEPPTVEVVLVEVIVRFPNAAGGDGEGGQLELQTYILDPLARAESGPTGGSSGEGAGGNGAGASGNGGAGDGGGNMGGGQ